jgi:hypothetical protein
MFQDFSKEIIIGLYGHEMFQDFSEPMVWIWGWGTFETTVIH